MQRLDARPHDIGGVGWLQTLAATLNERAATLVVIDGDRGEWNAADPDSVRQVMAVTVGIVRSDDAGVPAAADACDLSVRIGEGSGTGYQFVGTQEQALEWIAQR